MRWQFLVLSALLPLIACKPARKDTPAPAPDPNLLVVNESGVSLGGERLADAPSDAWMKIEPLTKKLRERRDAWSKEHPDNNNPPETLTLDLDPNMSCRAAMSVYMTAAQRGFEDLTVKLGDISVKLRYYALPGGDRCVIPRLGFSANFFQNGEVELSPSNCWGAFDVAPYASLPVLVRDLCAVPENCPEQLDLTCDANVKMAPVLAAVAEVAKSRPKMVLGLAAACSRETTTPFHPPWPDDEMVRSQNPQAAPSGSAKKKIPPPKIRVGPITITGKLDEKEVEDSLRPYLPKVQACYEAGLAEKPDLSGRAVVRMVVGRRGALMQVGNGDSELPDAGTLSCIVRLFRGTTPFPAKSGISVVLYSVSLSPK